MCEALGDADQRGDERLDAKRACKDAPIASPPPSTSRSCGPWRTTEARPHVVAAGALHSLYPWESLSAPLYTKPRHTHTHLHTYTHTHAHTYTPTRLCLHQNTPTHLHTYTCANPSTPYLRKSIYTHTHSGRSSTPQWSLCTPCTRNTLAHHSPAT